MTAEITVQLHCDGCDKTYDADVRATTGQVRIRMAANTDGWRTRYRRGEWEDHCPECQESIA
jgi:hypothetical protein